MLIFVIGLIIGSFLNVVICRLPEGDSIIFPASHCPDCGAVLQIPDLVPVLSFVLYRGRCRYCGAVISFQYPLVELLTAVMFALLYIQFGLDISFFIYALLVCLLIICSVIDLKEMIIPNRITYPGIIVGLLLSLTVSPLPIGSALMGVLIPGGVLLIIALAYQQGLGMGDVKLIAMIGSFMGWLYALLGLFIGALAGTLVGLPLILTGVLNRKTRIPFGPLISAGALIMLFWGEFIVSFYLGLF